MKARIFIIILLAAVTVFSACNSLATQSNPPVGAGQAESKDSADDNLDVVTSTADENESHDYSFPEPPKEITDQIREDAAKTYLETDKTSYSADDILKLRIVVAREDTFLGYGSYFDLQGWDEEKGGIFYFQDVEGKPVLSLEWDMKLFWPHCEGMIALLYSYLYTGEEKYMQWFEKIADYVYTYFPDEGHPEWYGHLHRDGTPISPIKGSDWKGPFHNVRAFMIISQLLEKIAAGEKIEL